MNMNRRRPALTQDVEITAITQMNNKTQKAVV